MTPNLQVYIEVMVFNSQQLNGKLTSAGSGAVSGLDVVAATAAASTACSSLEAAGAAHPSSKVWSWHAGQRSHCMGRPMRLRDSKDLEDRSKWGTIDTLRCPGYRH